ncbi:Molecular chaperone HscB [Fasciola gigantica]|uniref:Molecular chaperone HscB n=1 Tax=Fasciola gigantica TaxID=46835 RepID=A0A504Z1D3_FASGI|nr:Molecular chaperone HscB [Fasciola gigantica]
MDGGLTKCSPAISSRFISSSSHSSLSCFTRSISSRTCWNCQKVVPQGEYFCSCGKIQPVPPEANYFNLLGYPNYVARIDASELSNRMRAAQRQLHPDKFSRVPFYEKSLAADASTAINKAYSTLASPADRFEYILSVYSPLEAEHNLQDPEFLMEILELSEELEHLLNELNKTSSIVDVPSDKKDHVVCLFHKFSRLAKQEENNISSLLTDQKWLDAQLHLSRFRYFLRLMEQFRENDTAWKILEQASVDLKRA